LTRQGTLAVDKNSLATSVRGVFAGGDAISGPATVIEAIAAGDVAAESIDRYVSGKKLRKRALVRPTKPIPLPPRLAKIEKEIIEKRRPRLKKLAPKVRVNGFEEVEQGLTRQQAVEEAKRCLRCHEKD